MAWAWLYPPGVASGAAGLRKKPAAAMRSRAALLRRIGRAVEDARRRQCGCVLLRLQLSGIDAQLAMHGEAFVEAVLRVVAERVRRQLREDDLVARTGADEFALLAQGVDCPLRVAGDAIARRLIDSLGKPYGVDGVRFELGMRIGIAGFPDNADNASGLLLLASQALHAARRADENGWRFAAPTN